MYASIGITEINIPTIRPFLAISGDLSFTPRYMTIPPNIENNIGTKYHILLGFSSCDIDDLYQPHYIILSFFFLFSVLIRASSNSSLVCLNFFILQLHLAVIACEVAKMVFLSTVCTSQSFRHDIIYSISTLTTSSLSS